MKKLSLLMVIAGVMGLLAGTGRAEMSRTIEAFDQCGVIVDPHTFFNAARDAGAVVVAHQEVAGRSLVTEAGVYAFIETPENAQRLSPTVPGSVVRIRGKLLQEGALVYIDSLELQTRVPLIDFARYRNDAGEQVTLKGVNKCQCGLEVGGLPRTCALGHLHHLEAADGRIYHYLQFAQGKQAFLGEGFHFQSVEVKAKRLPGNYLLVDSAQVE